MNNKEKELDSALEELVENFKSEHKSAPPSTLEEHNKNLDKLVLDIELAMIQEIQKINKPE